jgi:hypothetical protein
MFVDMEATKQRTSVVVRDLVTGVCQPGAQVDLVQDIIAPICDALFVALLGASHPANLQDDVSASQIFDLYLGLNRRRKINKKAEAMLEVFAASRTLKTSADYATALSIVLELKINTQTHYVLHFLDGRGQLAAFYATIFGEADVSPSPNWRRPRARRLDHLAARRAYGGG